VSPALLIFLLTYLVLAIGRFPGLRMDRPGAAIIGAAFLIGLDVLSFDEAFRAVDYQTIVLLFGMMIVVANLRLSGFFSLVASWAIRHAHRPLTMLAAVIAVSGIFSAFFVNDTMCLVLTPLVLEVMARLKRNPVPYLLAVAMSSNVGSVATITGNPQNMMIGSMSGIPYRTFTAALGPVAVAGLVLTFALITIAYRREFAVAAPLDSPPMEFRLHRPLLYKSLAVSAGMVAFFFSGWPVAKVAIVAGAILLITRRLKPRRVYMEIDWQLLVLFTGLFIVVAAVEHTSLEEDLLRVAQTFRLDRVPALAAAAALVSNIVSNVPAVLLFRPVIPQLPDPQLGWLTLAMASTLAGNLTLVGSVANLIVVERAGPEVRIGFWEHFRLGAPLTVLTLAFGIGWLVWVR
jgi:Na+/H+ antiporter NhaD/arsenite permease-like protein